VQRWWNDTAVDTLGRLPTAASIARIMPRSPVTGGAPKGEIGSTGTSHLSTDRRPTVPEVRFRSTRVDHVWGADNSQEPDNSGQFVARCRRPAGCPRRCVEANVSMDAMLTEHVAVDRAILPDSSTPVWLVRSRLRTTTMSEKG
jgi:hypothetical protein